MILGVYSGCLLPDKLECADYTLKPFPLLTPHIDGTPPVGRAPSYTHALAYINEYLWDQSQNNASITAGGVIITTVPIPAGAQICMAYGPDYDWDGLRCRLIRKSITYLRQILKLQKQWPSLALTQLAELTDIIPALSKRTIRRLSREGAGPAGRTLFLLAQASLYPPSPEEHVYLSCDSSASLPEIISHLTLNADFAGQLDIRKAANPNQRIPNWARLYKRDCITQTIAM
jgi:hypothetical protein